MMDPAPYYVNERQSDLRGVKEGWYAIDDHGKLVFGPFSIRQDCLSTINESVARPGDLQARRPLG